MSPEGSPGWGQWTVPINAVVSPTKAELRPTVASFLDSGLVTEATITRTYESGSLVFFFQHAQEPAFVLATPG